MERLAFFGLGAIGYGVAANLLKAGFPLNVVMHRNREPVDRLVENGAILCDSKRKATESSDIVFLCLPDSDVVNDTIDEIWPSLDERHLVVDTGTSSSLNSVNLAKRLKTRGISFAESPLAGGKAQAESAEMGAFVGCSVEVFEQIEPILNQFCASVQHFGPVGSGSRAKLISNYLVLSMVRLIIETFHAADILEIDWQKFYEIIRRGSSNSMALQRMIGSILEEENYGGYVFTVQGAVKDLRYIAELSEQNELGSLSDAALKLFGEATELGFGNLAVSELLREEIRQQLTELVGEKKD